MRKTGPCRLPAIAGFLALLHAASFAQGDEARPGFEPANTVSQIRSQLRRLPDDDIWWTVNGRDMAWNFRNLHLIFPAAKVYRDGPVRELRRRPMKEIAEFRVETPEGPMSFEDFIASDQSTTLGVVILHRGDIVFERYPRMQEHEQPVYWSTSKVFPATLIRLLEERGRIDVVEPQGEEFLAGWRQEPVATVALNHREIPLGVRLSRVSTEGCPATAGGYSSHGQRAFQKLATSALSQHEVLHTQLLVPVHRIPSLSGVPARIFTGFDARCKQ